MPVVIANAAMLAITYDTYNIVSMYVIYNIESFATLLLAASTRSCRSESRVNTPDG